MRTEVCQLRFISLSLCRLERKRNLRVAHVQSVEKWLAMDKRSVIDIERDLANQGKRVLTIFVIENPHISCNQTAKGIQRQAPYIGFDAAFV